MRCSAPALRLVLLGTEVVPPRGSPVAFSAGFDPLPELRAAGFTPTSGFRTQAHQDALRAQGLTATRTGSHTRGDGIDITPPPGMSKQEGIAWVKHKYPGSRAAPSNGRAIHVTFPGWGKAPDISGSRRRYGG